MSRVYIHEFVDIVGHHRADYLRHVTHRWAPVGRTQRRQRCVGVWAVVGSTGRWPQVVNLWEYASWDDLAHNFAVELTGDGLQDPELERWWAEAAAYRSGGHDRILVSPDWSPTVEDLCRVDRPARAGYAHELIRTPPGVAGELLAAVRQAVATEFRCGLELIGAFRRAMGADDEVILIWSFPDWSTWGAWEAGMAEGTSASHDWRTEARGALGVQRWERILLADAPESPLRTGRQPGAPA